jgi:hypothetical protein
MKIKFLIGILILIGSVAADMAAAEPDYGVNLSVFAYTTPEYVKDNAYDINFRVDAENIPQWAYPIEARYISDGKEVFNKTIESGSGSFGSGTSITISGKPDGMYKHTEVQLISAGGVLIGLADTYAPIYLFDGNRNIDLQLIVTNITATKRCEIFCFFEEPIHNARFTIKNMNDTFAFNGEIQFGDLGVASPWKAERKVVLGPGQTIEIERSNITTNDLQDLRTELRICRFCY